jgi:hypothetical protein
MEPYLKVYGFTHTSSVDGVKICMIQGNPHVPCRLDSYGKEHGPVAISSDDGN